MDWLDQIAARLQPQKKMLFIGTLLSIILFALLPVLAGTLSGRLYPKAMWAIAIIPVLGMTTCWGLFCIAYGYAPGKGPLSPEVLRRKHWLLALYGRFCRLVALVFWLVWFLAPLIFLVIVLVEKQ